ncbi:hypothetical protein [Alkalicoccus chagannorensis]|uniref:hypothetical protein n=1 Tax=Alkalicoccus chagannorensis TaxID=427072 RepID=UPI00047C0A0E|nr:hypothetical protein [Alkalicoccus chagannorensis]
MLVFWNPIGDHNMSISFNQIGKYDAMQLHSVERTGNLRIMLEDNHYSYLFDYEQSPLFPFDDVYAVVRTPEHMRTGLMEGYFEILEKEGIPDNFWPFFKVKHSSLLTWTRNAVDIHMPKEKNPHHYVYVTVDEVIEVIADRDPTVTIKTL